MCIETIFGNSDLLGGDEPFSSSVRPGIRLPGTDAGNLTANQLPKPAPPAPKPPRELPNLSAMQKMMRGRAYGNPTNQGAYYF